MPRLKPNDIPLTPEENARVKAAIAADPETFELDDEWFARARPTREVVPDLVAQYRQYRAGQLGHRYLLGDALVCADNLDVMRELPDECVDLIYLDPPFNSNQFYVAAFGDKGMVRAQLRDIWSWTVETENAFQRIPHGRLLDCLRGIILQTGEQSKMAAYCVYMGRRLAEMHRVLKSTGSIYLHCDPHANAYLRILMNAIFGENQFRNEIVWHYNKWTNAASHFQRNHDTLFFYAKSGKAKYNKQFQMTAHKERVIGRGWDSNVVQGGVRQLLVYDRAKAAGEIAKEKYDRIVYRDESDRGTAMPDVWSDINYLSSGAKERVGYPTQKPLALLERIIEASSNYDDLVLDPFCGCGTAADAAASLGRRYLGIDISGIAVRVMQQRLESRGYPAPPVVYGLEWNDFDWKGFKRRALLSRDLAEDGIPGWAWAEDKVAGLLNAVPNQRKQGDGGVDARYFGAFDLDRSKDIVIPIQVKMHAANRSIGRPDMDRLLGTQTAWQNRGLHAPMSIMVTLFPPPESVRVFAAQQGRVTLHTRDGGRQEYPVMQALSVQEMLQRDERPALPPVDPRALVGDTQDKMVFV